MRENLDDELTEVKSENAIDRITSQANPRTLERVPAGARFRFRMVMDVLCEEDTPLLAARAEGAAAAGRRCARRRRSRGSGRVSFGALKLAWRSKDYYAKGAGETALIEGAGLAALQQLATQTISPGSSPNRMHQGLLIRLRPLGPWRFGPSDGAVDRLDALFRSDRLYSAVTLAMRQLGRLEDWLNATARAGTPAVALSSLFPFQGDTLFAIPPASVWPPPPSLVTAPSPVFLTKVRWRAARFVPLSVIESLLTGQNILADQWAPDAESGCLLRRDRPSSSPFRVVQRSRAAVDRVTGRSERAERLACVEFEAGSGLWTAVRFFDEAAAGVWTEAIQAAFRLLADAGFGARRTSGWGQTAAPEFQEGVWPQILMPKLKPTRNGTGNGSSRLYSASLSILARHRRTVSTGAAALTK